MPIHGSVFSVVQISTSRPRYSTSFFSIPDLPVPGGLKRGLVVGPEHLLGPADVELGPRKTLRERHLAPRVEFGVQPHLFKDLHPTVEVEVFIPLVEPPPLPARLDQGGGQTPVAPREDAL